MSSSDGDDEFLVLLKKLREELTRALLETSSTDGQIGIREIEDPTLLPASFKDLVKDVTSNKQDIKTLAFKTKAMVTNISSRVLCFCGSVARYL